MVHNTCLEDAISALRKLIPKSVNLDALNAKGKLQIGKKYGKHGICDYGFSGASGLDLYKELALDVYNNADSIIYDKIEHEFYFIKDKDLLRLMENGDFVSLYPGANSSRVLKAINKGFVLK